MDECKIAARKVMKKLSTILRTHYYKETTNKKTYGRIGVNNPLEEGLVIIISILYSAQNQLF